MFNQLCLARLASGADLSRELSRLKLAGRKKNPHVAFGGWVHWIFVKNGWKMWVLG